MAGKRCKVVLEVVEVRGKCPIYKVGDKVAMDEPAYLFGTKSYRMPEETNAICIGFATSLFAYEMPLLRGIDPVKLWLAKEGGSAYITCQAPDVGETPKAHGTVIWKVHQIPEQESLTDKFYEEIGHDR